MSDSWPVPGGTLTRHSICGSRCALVLWVLVLAACVTDAEVDRLLDVDRDGYRTVEADGLDCDDSNAAISPDADEICDDGIDNDCDGVSDDAGVGEVTWYADDDNDGFGKQDVTISRCPGADLPGWVLQAGDCDDEDGSRRPGVTELCNRVDDDCDDVVDEGC